MFLSLPWPTSRCLYLAHIKPYPAPSIPNYGLITANAYIQLHLIVFYHPYKPFTHTNLRYYLRVYRHFCLSSSHRSACPPGDATHLPLATPSPTHPPLPLATPSLWPVPQETGGLVTEDTLPYYACDANSLTCEATKTSCHSLAKKYVATVKVRGLTPRRCGRLQKHAKCRVSRCRPHSPPDHHCAVFHPYCHHPPIIVRCFTHIGRTTTSLTRVSARCVSLLSRLHFIASRPTSQRRCRRRRPTSQRRCRRRPDAYTFTPQYLCPTRPPTHHPPLTHTRKGRHGGVCAVHRPLVRVRGRERVGHLPERRHRLLRPRTQPLRPGAPEPHYTSHTYTHLHPYHHPSSHPNSHQTHILYLTVLPYVAPAPAPAPAPLPASACLCLCLAGGGDGHVRLRDVLHRQKLVGLGVGDPGRPLHSPTGTTLPIRESCREEGVQAPFIICMAPWSGSHLTLISPTSLLPRIRI